jgi:uncharacterized protein YjbJ (UPF0337 family)
MNSDVLKGKWTQVKGDIRVRWGKITDSDLTQIEGESEKLIGKLQEAYGYSREQAEKELKGFLDSPKGHAKRAT